MHDRDHRHRQALERVVRRERLQPPRAHLVPAHPLAFLEIRAGAEDGTIGSHEDEPDGVVRSRARRGAEQSFAHRAVERVAALRTVQRDGGEAVGDAQRTGLPISP